ncbi:MAG: hypothetical protein WC044_06070 [Crocinitomicaceae bacterium]
MTYKYQEKLKDLSCECPQEDLLKPFKGKAYRFVHEDENHVNNFLPVLMISPSRIEDFEECSKKCIGYGLSLYDDFNKAEKKLISHLNRKPLLADVLGNCVAEGNLTPSDGKASEIDSNGHFTFHESAESNIKVQFTHLKKVI